MSDKDLALKCENLGQNSGIKSMQEGDPHCCLAHWAEGRIFDCGVLAGHAHITLDTAMGKCQDWKEFKGCQLHLKGESHESEEGISST